MNIDIKVELSVDGDANVHARIDVVVALLWSCFSFALYEMCICVLHVF